MRCKRTKSLHLKVKKMCLAQEMSIGKLSSRRGEVELAYCWVMRNAESDFLAARSWLQRPSGFCDHLHPYLYPLPYTGFKSPNTLKGLYWQDVICKQVTAMLRCKRSAAMASFNSHTWLRQQTTTTSFENEIMKLNILIRVRSKRFILSLDALGSVFHKAQPFLESKLWRLLLKL